MPGREFKVGDLVYARNYRDGLQWLPRKVSKIDGLAMYTIVLEDGRNVSKHADQLKCRAVIDNTPVTIHVDEVKPPGVDSQIPRRNLETMTLNNPSQPMK